MSFAVNDFFANGGAQAVIVRLATASAVAATITLPEDTAVNASPPASPPLHGALPPDLFSNLVLVAASPGTWGNGLWALVDHKTKDPNDLSLFNLTLTLKDPTGTITLATEKYLNVSIDPASSRYVTTTLLQNSILANVQVDGLGNDDVPGTRPADTITTIVSPPQQIPNPVQGVNGDDGDDFSDNDFVGPGTQPTSSGSTRSRTRICSTFSASRRT